MNAGDQLDQLIAYVEGQMPPDQRAEFERLLAGSPQLRQQLELMQRVDESLVLSFAAPGFLQFDFTKARAQAAVSATRTGQWKRWTGIVGSAIAAAIVIVATIQFKAAYDRRHMNDLTVSKLYDGQVAGGFKPDYVCKSDPEFVEYSTKSFGIPLLAQSDSTVTIVGWTYSDISHYKDLGISTEAKIILARVKNQPVVLLLDKNDVRGPKVDSAARGRLNVFESNVGGVDIFEITPLKEPLATKKFAVASRN